MTTSTALAEIDNLGELIHRLGDISPARVLLHPTPGTATPADALRLLNGDRKRLVELWDGTLVEKLMGHHESRLAVQLVALLVAYLEKNDLGVLSGPDGPYRLNPREVRLPDVSFVSYDRIPDAASPEMPLPEWKPNLVVEVISEGNTRQEMERSLREYFNAGVELVWYLYPKKREAHVFTSHRDCSVLSEDDVLSGQQVLPGFQVSLKSLFDKAARIHTRKN